MTVEIARSGVAVPKAAKLKSVSATVHMQANTRQVMDLTPPHKGDDNL